MMEYTIYIQKYKGDDDMSIRDDLGITELEEQLEEYKRISDEYGVGFEINDFYYPDVLDNEERTSVLIRQYERIGIPKGSTMHGAFLDVTIFSQDEAIRKVSQRRMEQSMKIKIKTYNKDG